MQWFLLILCLPYFILLLRIYRELIRIKPFSSSHAHDVFISVIAACRNEEKNLSLLLNDITVQDYSQNNFELIIVDDNSSDGTYAIASGFKGIRHLKVLKNIGTGKKKAIRSGVAVSSGSLILTTDADCRMGSGWITSIAGSYEQKKPEMIICSVVLEGGKGFFQWFQELEFLSLQGITAGTASAGNPVMCNGANLAFTKESYDKHSLELHDELASGDDVFLLHCIKKEKDKIMWLESEDVRVTTKSSETIRSFLHQRARWISKAGSYNDRYSRILAIVTFITILIQLAALIAGIFDPVFLLIFLIIFGLKSVPDYLILQNTTQRYKRRYLMKWFIPSQFLYPFYIVAVLIYSILRRRGFRETISF